MSRLFGVAAGGGGGPGHPEFERAFRHRLSGLPAHLAPIASVQGFDADGRPSLDVSREGPGSGRVYDSPDIASPDEGLEPVPVASTFDAPLEILGHPGEESPERLTLVQGGDLDGFRRWLDRNPSRLREKDGWGWTSLDHAVFEGRREIVDYLTGERDVTPGMAFYDALIDGRFPTARGMLRHGLDPDLIGPTLARKGARPPRRCVAARISRREA